MRWAGHVAYTKYHKNVYMVLLGKLERNRPLGRPRRKREFNIRMDFRRIGSDGMDWIYQDQWLALVIR
jgi:hypothetical protein